MKKVFKTFCLVCNYNALTLKQENEETQIQVMRSTQQV